MTDVFRSEIKAKFSDMAVRPLRCLALATKASHAAKYPRVELATMLLLRPVNVPERVSTGRLQRMRRRSQVFALFLQLAFPNHHDALCGKRDPNASFLLMRRRSRDLVSSLRCIYRGAFGVSLCSECGVRLLTHQLNFCFRSKYFARYMQHFVCNSSFH